MNQDCCQYFSPCLLVSLPPCLLASFPADLDELAVHCLQYSLILHSGIVLQRLLSHLLLALQPLLDHAEASAGPPLLPALCHHTCGCVAAQVNCEGSLLALRHERICQVFITQPMIYIRAACLSCLSQGSGVHLALFLLGRYFYRACQSTLFPSPVQFGRQLDKVPTETRRNILSLSKVKVGSPLNAEPPFLSLMKPSPKICNKKDQRPVLQKDEHTDSLKGLSDFCSLAPTEADTLPYTKDTPQLPGEPQPPPTKDSECLNKTLETSDLSLSSWITSTPLLTQADSIQLKLPPDGGSQCVKYTRNSEKRSDHAVHPAQRTEQVVEDFLHTAL